MGFGPGAGFADSWSTNAAPTVGQLTPQVQSAEPLPSDPQHGAEPLKSSKSSKSSRSSRPKKKHRVVGVALVALVSLMIVGEGWRRMDQAPRNVEAPLADRSVTTNQAQPKRAPVVFTTPTTTLQLAPGSSAFGHYTTEQTQRRRERLRSNVRTEITVDRVAKDGSPLGHFVTEVRFASHDEYIMHATFTAEGGETTEFDVVATGGARYVRNSDLSKLGDRWLKNPTRLNVNLGESKILDLLGNWLQPHSQYVGVIDPDGFHFDRFTLEPKQTRTGGDVTVDASGTPFEMNVVDEDIRFLTDRLVPFVDHTHVRVFYEEPVDITVPTNVVSEAEFDAES
jgi:hypothetical protein